MIMSRFMYVSKHDGCQRKQPEVKARRINMSPKERRFLCFVLVLCKFSLAAKRMLYVLTAWLQMSYNHHANVLSTKRKWIMLFLALSPGFQLDDDQSPNTKNKIRERGANAIIPRSFITFIFSLPEQSRKQRHLSLFMCALGVLDGMFTCLPCLSALYFWGCAPIWFLEENNKAK